MTALPPNADELVSAYIDGQAAPDEIALVESSQEMLALVEQMRTVSSALAAPTAPDPARREFHLGAALQLFDELQAADADHDTDTIDEQGSDRPVLAAVPTVAAGTAAAAGTPPVSTTDSVPGVTSLAAERERRQRRFSPGLIAAALVAVAFIAIAAFGFGGPAGDDVATSDSAEVAADSVDDAADDAADDADDSADAMEEAVESDEAPAAADSDRSTQAQAEPEPAAGVAESFAAEAPPADDVAADDGEDSMADAAMDEEEAADPAEDDAADFDAADQDDAASDDDAGDASADDRPLFLGTFPSVDELVDDISPVTTTMLLAEQALNARFGTENGTTGCQDLIAGLSDLEQPTLFATAEVDGELVEVHVEPLETADPDALDEPLRVVVVAADTCEQLTP